MQANLFLLFLLVIKIQSRTAMHTIRLTCTHISRRAAQRPASTCLFRALPAPHAEVVAVELRLQDVGTGDENEAPTVRDTGKGLRCLHVPMLIVLLFAGVDCSGDSRKPSNPAMARAIKQAVRRDTRAPLTLMGVPASKSGELTTISPEWSS